MVIAILPICIVLLCIVLLSKIRLLLYVNTQSRSFDIRAGIFGIKIHLPTMGKHKSLPPQHSSEKHFEKLRKFLIYLSIFRVRIFHLHVVIGTGDAAADACMAGGLKAAICALCSAFVKSFKDADIAVNIFPNFKNTMFFAEFHSEIHIRLLDVIKQSIKNLYKKAKRGITK